MANSNLSTTLDEFAATVHRTKNRLVAIPAETQRKLGLTKRRDNHLLSYSIRLAGRGRWNHLLSKLTYDNEFEIPAGFSRIAPGDRVEVKIHRLIADVPVPLPRSAGETVLSLPTGEDERTDGSQNVDAYLYGEKRR
jgi:hypothetical protein